MGKIFIFGIGGTGSRVLRSLIHLLASGVKINASEIVPIIIDADHGCADLTRTIKLIRDYNSIRDNLDFTSNHQNNFFGTKINTKILPELLLPLNNTNTQFKEYIGLSTMSANNRSMAEMLFSQKNLDSEMSVGFKGNPNVGSVVLNQFNQSEEFQTLWSSFAKDDRIFIISSIFGGTGASGYPLLVKNIRNIDSNIPQSEFVKNAPIGALSILPYFDLKQDQDSEIDSSTFISKTKAALYYYDKNIDESNVTYYLADTIRNNYDNHEGGMDQQNDAHFVEIAAALSIIDFASINQDELVTNDGKPEECIYKEFGIEDDVESIIFNNLSSKTNSIIRKPLAQFVLFMRYLREHIEEGKKQTWSQGIFDERFYNSDFYAKIKQFMELTYSWYKELEGNCRSFAPFDLGNPKIETKNLFSFIKGVEPNKSIFAINKNYNLFDKELNVLESKIDKGTTTKHRFVELFYQATNKLMDSKFNF